jgi:hypothetical protein
MRAVRIAMMAALAGSLVTLAACAPSPDAPPTPSASPAATATAEPVVAEPTVPAPDPGDVSTWVVGSVGIGPVERGGSWAAVQERLSGFAAETMCPSAAQLTADGAASIFVGLEEDGDTIRQVWATAGSADAASPATAAGIALGASLDEVQAAYPGIEQSAAPYPTAEAFYAVADSDESWIVLSLRDDVVAQIGASAVPFPPKELCG